MHGRGFSVRVHRRTGRLTLSPPRTYGCPQVQRCSWWAEPDRCSVSVDACPDRGHQTWACSSLHRLIGYSVLGESVLPTFRCRHSPSPSPSPPSHRMRACSMPSRYHSSVLQASPLTRSPALIPPSMMGTCLLRCTTSPVMKCRTHPTGPWPTSLVCGGLDTICAYGLKRMV